MINPIDAWNGIVDADQTPAALTHDGAYWPRRHKKMGKVDLNGVDLWLAPVQVPGAEIPGSEIRKYASDLPMLNGTCFQAYLRYPHLIPREWRRTDGTTLYVCFWGTDYANKSGDLNVSAIYWDEKKGAFAGTILWHGSKIWDDTYPAAILQR